MIEYIADEGVPIGVWEGQCRIVYKKQSLVLTFAAEPPFGDFIYWAELENSQNHYGNQNEKTKLEFWIYGRGIVFLKENFAILEAVEPNTTGPIETKILNLKNATVASLGKWYNIVERIEPNISLKTSYDNEFLELDLEKLKWESI